MEGMIDSMSVCNKCGNMSVIQVAISSGIPFFSCITEGCEREAQLLVDIGDGELVRYDKVYDTFKKIVNYGISNETDDNEGEG